MLYDVNREKLENIASDALTDFTAPDIDPATGKPTGRMIQGKSAGYNVTEHAYGHPQVRWGDILLTLDVYRMPNGLLEVHLYCPECAKHGDKHMLRVTSERKRIDYNPTIDPDRGGRLNVERFRCVWVPDKQNFSSGVHQCTWSVEIANNIARD